MKADDADGADLVDSKGFIEQQNRKDHVEPKSHSQTKKSHKKHKRSHSKSKHSHQPAVSKEDDPFAASFEESMAETKIHKTHSKKH